MIAPPLSAPMKPLKLVSSTYDRFHFINTLTTLQHASLRRLHSRRKDPPAQKFRAHKRELNAFWSNALLPDLIKGL